MDSLLSSYASSDSDDEQLSPPLQPPQQQPSSSKPTTSSSSLFSSLPKPSSSSSSSSSSSISFSALPPPKSKQTLDSSPLPPSSNPKRVVQFRPPQIPIPNKHDDDDGDDEEDKRDKERKREKSQLGLDNPVKSFRSFIPAPKYSGVAALGGSSGGRRSVVETAEPAAPAVSTEVAGSAVGTNQESSNESLAGSAADVSHSHLYNYDMGSANHGGVEPYAAGVSGAEYAGNQNYEQQGYEQQSNNYDSSNNNSWYFDSNSGLVGGAMVVEASSGGAGAGLDSFMGGGKRRRDKLPAEIVEVKQDELMNNRPTEDKSKLTGSVYGPGYQPASSKGKPSKQHKRKHQITSLYYDVKEKEAELAERRAKGFLTKAETQAKYGW